MAPGDVQHEDQQPSGYAAHRREDPRIAAQVHEALGDARVVLNVGAGAGSYEPTDRRVTAVEPSATMRSQRPPGAAPAMDATAEQLPFEDLAFDASMAMITLHQWADARRGLRQMRRVTRGPVVVLTFDPDALDRFWLAHYVPELVEFERRRFPGIDWIRQVLGGRSEVVQVPVPADCTDGFVEAFYGRPELLLEPRVRAAQSGWRGLEPGVEDRAAQHLLRDLESGDWDARWADLRELPAYDGSLRLVVAHPD